MNEFVHVEGYVENGDISPDGSHVFLELFWGTALTSIDLASGDEVAHVDAADFGEARFWAIRVSPDGRYVDAAHGPGVSRFDAGTLELITHVDVGAPPRTGFNPTDLGGIRDLAHVPGTNDVVAVGQLGRVYRVDMDRGELTATGQSADPTTLGRVGISDDGSIVAATNVATATVAFFDADTLDPISDPRPAGDGNFAPWFTPDGDLVGNSALGISERELDPDEWQSAACRLAGRNLTRAEWADYLGDEPYRATCPEWPPATG